MFFGQNKYIVILQLLGLSCSVLAQKPDSVISLGEVAIISTPIRQVSTTSFNEQISPALIADFASHPVSELIARTSAVIINQYGPGGLATISLRGSGSSQTAILWNGFNLQSPMNGGMNLSQLPVSFIDEIEVNHGGQGAQQGNSAIGGVVQMNTKVDIQSGFSGSLTQMAGSFGNYFSGLKLRYGFGNVSLSTRIFYQTAENDFPFINTAQYGKPRMKQPNAALKQYGVLQTALWQVNPDQQLTIRFWAQSYDKDLPPLMSNLSSQQHQLDDDYRIATEWNGVKGRFNWVLRSGYLFNKQIYSDEASGIKADNRASSWQNNFEGMWRLSDSHRLIFQAGSSFESGLSDNYSGARHRNLTWIMLGYRYAFSENKAVITTSIREELTDLTTTAPTFAVGTDIQLSNRLILHSNIARSYRIPTLNDLYWNIWGNPGLKPEQGYTFDLGINYKHKAGSWCTEIGVTGFSNHISDWIIWLPKGLIWTPENLKMVWSRGIESQASVVWVLFPFNAGVTAKYNYTRAAQLNTANTPVNERLQLIYVPEHKAMVSLTFGWKRFDIRFDQSYTGQRYTDADNLIPLDSYLVGDISIGNRFELRRWNANVRIRINNVFDENYQAVAWYAMPGRSVELSITFSFNEPVN